MKCNNVPNDVKIRRLENQIKELKELCEKSHEPQTSKYTKAIERRQEAITFIKERRGKIIGWKPLMNKFKFNSRFNPDAKNLINL